MPKIICRNCGNAVLPNERFCPKCGAALEINFSRGENRTRSFTRILLMMISSIYIPVFFLALLFVSLSGGAQHPDQYMEYLVIVTFPFTIAASIALAWRSYNREEYGIALLVILIPIGHVGCSLSVPGIW